MPLNSQPFLLLPQRFLTYGLLLYVVVELLGSLVLQYMLAAQADEQSVIIGMRLFQLFGFVFLIYHFSAIDCLGLSFPTKKSVYVFAVIASFCVLMVLGLYLTQPSWFKYIALPSWLNGLSGLLLMVVLAPIVEELVFRGLLYRILRERWNVLVSVVASAVFFSLVHHGMIVSPQLAGGLIFAAAYEWSRSLWVAIALHVGANAAVYLLSVLAFA